MKKIQTILCGILAAVLALAFTACPNSVEPSPPSEPTTGSITGRALLADGASNGGIVITLEETSGPLSASVVRASRGASPRTPVAATARTNADGSFVFGDLPPGTYTLHASSQDSLARAVAIGITVRANEAANVGTLNLTLAGEISGQVTVDGYGAMGFIVSVAGTSFMAVTDEDGTFTIGGVPAGERRLIVARGHFVTFFAQPVNVVGGENAKLDPKDITSASLDNTPHIGPNGNWWVGGRDLGVRAQGWHGEIPHIGENGNWWIGNLDLRVRAQGAQGEVPRIGPNGNWWVGDHDLGVRAQGDDGEAPRIGPNGNWWVGDHDLGVRAQGDDGEVPHVGPNGNWWIGDRDLEIRAQGPVGVSIVWKGELASSPLNPQPNWAYFNTTNRNAWIWNGSWYHLSERGESGAVGADGVGLVWRGSFDGFGHPDLADPQVNWAFYNTTSRRSYVFDGETWQVLARDGPQADDPSGYVFVPVTGVSLEMASLRLPGGRSRTLVANVYPANATINAVLWSSDNPAVARVDAVTGQITAVSSTGTARITAATLNGGVMATIEVEVVPGLPSLHLSIEPYERGGPTALHRTIWRNTTVSLRGIGIYEEFVFEEVSAQARGRGNSSWRYMGNKRPLRIRFDTQRPMFGSSYAVRDWTLIANTIDHSMMRNYSAYFLGALLKGQYSSPARHFLHLYMDGEYRGVYMLSSQMHGREGRFEITYNANPALSEYFLEMCLRVPGEGGPYVLAWDPVHLRHIPIGITDPRGSDLTLEHQQFVQDFILQVDYALQGRDFYEISQIIDIPSFVDYYLVQEFFKNFDAFQSSLFFSIKQTYTNPILFAGPLWDFDISSGNGYGDFALPGFEWVAHLNPYFNSLMRVNCFRELVIVRWNEIRYNQIKTMIDHIRSLTSKYEACFEHNFYRWPDKNIWWDHEEYFHREHVEVLIDWFEQRWIWLDWWFSQ